MNTSITLNRDQYENVFLFLWHLYFQTIFNHRAAEHSEVLPALFRISELIQLVSTANFAHFDYQPWMTVALLGFELSITVKQELSHSVRLTDHQVTP